MKKCRKRTKATTVWGCRFDGQITLTKYPIGTEINNRNSDIQRKDS